MANVRCTNPSHGVKFHVQGTAAAQECAGSTRGGKPGRGGSVPKVSASQPLTTIDGLTLETAEPPQVDERIADIFRRYYVEMDKVDSLMYSRERLWRYNGRRELVSEPSEATVKVYDDKIADAQAKADAIFAEVHPYQAEFKRRGGWTRAFEVLNDNGHIHKSQQCPTCYDTTKYGWHTSMSGMDEETIVEAAGEKACTHCYPTAPVEVRNRPSTLELPEHREAREARERERAERNAERDAKSISNPDGSPLRTEYGVIHTVHTAEQEFVGNLANHLAFDYRYKAGESEAILRALVHKRGGDPDAVYELHDDLLRRLGGKVRRDIKEGNETIRRLGMVARGEAEEKPVPSAKDVEFPPEAYAVFDWIASEEGLDPVTYMIGDEHDEAWVRRYNMQAWQIASEHPETSARTQPGSVVDLAPGELAYRHKFTEPRG